jgi:CxxC-x17-CxxC domain-containing protein
MATFTDKTLKCVECGADFTYAASEQELHQSLGYQNEPKRCSPCREAKRARKGDSRGGGRGAGSASRGPGGSGPREFFTAVCGECGKEAQLPFKPRGDRPVYCSDCFSKRRTSI